MIDIIDVGSGNVQSLKNILALLNVSSRSVRALGEIKSDIVILPGVGSARHYMSRLKDTGLDKAILNHVNEGRRVLGICLGFQLLTKFSEEDGGVDCLGLIDAEAVKLDESTSTSSHTGWEPFDINTNFLKKGKSKAQLSLTLKRTLEGRVFYNHEYGVVTKTSKYQTKKINDTSLSKYTAMLVNENVIGVQFHPEKSQSTGLRLLAMLL